MSRLSHKQCRSTVSLENKPILNCAAIYRYKYAHYNNNRIDPNKNENKEHKKWK